MNEQKNNLFNNETPETQNETETKTLSEEEAKAKETLENIFKSVSQHKTEQTSETESKSDSEPEPMKADVTPEEEPEPKKSNQTEIELLTVRKPTAQQKRAMERKKHAREKRKKKRLFWKVLLAAVIVAITLFGGYLFADYMPDKQQGEVVITIPQGASTAQVAEELHKNKLIHSKEFYRFMSKMKGVDGNYNFGKFKLPKGAGYEEIFHVLTQVGQNVDLIKVTIPEGYEIYKIADLLEEKGLIDKDEFYHEINYGEFDYAFVKEIPQRDNRLEGYLFPSTYEFAPGDEHAIIDEMLGLFQKKYEPYRARTQELGMTMDEVITLASIIEREAIGAEDRNLVSSVFHNRLKSPDYPYLQSCATVQYVLKERKPVLSEADTKIDSPYNTYINPGLPVGPIASPGVASIEAALYPEETNYLFFVLGSDNKHHFSVTYEEHIQNKAN